MLDEFERVALRGAARALTRGQIDPDADAGVAVGRRVDVAAKDASTQMVGTEATDEEVVALAALEHVGAVVADQLIVEGGADQVFDVDQRVAVGRAVESAPERQADRDACVGIDVQRRVDAVAAIEVVSAAVSAQAVVAILAQKHVGGVIAFEPIVDGGADQIFNIAQQVTLGIAAEAASRAQADADAAGGVRVGGRVDAVAAVENVGAAAALQRVVTAATGQPVAAAAPFEGIG